ncbi:MAG: hypothetical protein ACRD7E_19125, partial [Bryobacteraceae bacterium]
IRRCTSKLTAGPDTIDLSSHHTSAPLTSKPAKDGIRFGSVGDLLQTFPSEPLTNLSQRGTLRIEELQPRRKMSPEDSVLGGKILVLQSSS